jgi:hypothetical protein
MVDLFQSSKNKAGHSLLKSLPQIASPIHYRSGHRFLKCQNLLKRH